MSVYKKRGAGKLVSLLLAFCMAGNFIPLNALAESTEESPLAGYPVYLYAESDAGAVVQTSTTDSNGEYEFTNAESGDTSVTGMDAGMRTEPGAAAMALATVSGDISGNYPDFPAAIAAINADSGSTYMVTMDANETITALLTIDPGKNVTLTSDNNGPYTLTQTGTNVRHFSVAGSLTLADVILSGGSTANPTSGGGGVKVADGGSFTMNSGAVVKNCFCSDPGGGVYVDNGGNFAMNGGTISGNSAGNSGGGVYVAGNGNFTMNGGTISGNSTTAHGGGICIAANNANTINISDAEISGNIAGSGADGGGVAVYAYSRVEIYNSTIENNSGAHYGGGASARGSGSTIILDSSSVIQNNSAQYGGGASTRVSGSKIILDGSSVIQSNSATYGGGVIALDTGSKIILDGSSIIQKNNATYGGGVHVFNGTFIMESGTITGNTATNSGGGVHLTRGVGTSAFTMNGGTISGNKANSGGGVYVNSYTNLNITGGEISDNGKEVIVDATSYKTSGGGGIYIASGNTTTIDISGAAIDNNAATGNGGGIYSNSSGAVSISGGSVSDNTAGSATTLGNGGGIYNASSGSVSISGVKVSGNTATSNNTGAGSGGGIYNISGTLAVTGGSEITGNTASGNGGGIYTTNYANITTASNTVFSGNSASMLYYPPANAATSYPAIEFALTSISHLLTGNDHPINNYDINYDKGTAISVINIDVEYYFDGAHDSSYDTTIARSSAATVNRSDVVLATTPVGYALATPPTDPTLPDSASNLDGTTVKVYYMTDPSQTASINVEYYFDGIHNSSLDTTITPQILATVNQSDVLLGTIPAGYMLAATPTNPALPASTSSLDGMTVRVYYVTSLSQTAYTLTIQAGTGGTITMGTSGQYAAGSVITIMAAPDNNYTFSGWTSNNGGMFGTVSSAGTTFTMPAANVIITAVFTRSPGVSSGGSDRSSSRGGGSSRDTTTYTVTYSANGGAGSDYRVSGISSGSNHTVLHANNTVLGYRYDGYIFTGWNTAADGSGMAYAPGDIITVTKSLTLYAQWDEESLSTEDDGETANNPKTGGTNNTELWVYLMCFSLVSAAILLWVSRGREHSRWPKSD